jgi:lipopolysaccharide transport system permease protein
MSVTATEPSPTKLREPPIRPVPEDEPVRHVDTHETVIQATRGFIGINWGEMVAARELLYFFIWRDLKVRYKQAILGVGWAVIQPVMSMIIFTAIFGAAAGFAKNIGPKWEHKYAVFVYAGLLPWQLMGSALSLGGLSLLSQQHLVKKVYFPRLFVPTAAVGGALVDMGISWCIVACLMVYYQVMPAWAAIFLPLLLILSLTLALGAAFLLSALTIAYRDFRFLIPFMSQIWMWVSFVAFPVPLSIQNSHKWQALLFFNPMFGIISSYRKILLNMSDDVTGWRPTYLISSIVISALVFSAGVFYFRRTERRFADIA